MYLSEGTVSRGQLIVSLAPGAALGPRLETKILIDVEGPRSDTLVKVGGLTIVLSRVNAVSGVISTLHTRQNTHTAAMQQMHRL